MRIRENREIKRSLRNPQGKMAVRCCKKQYVSYIGLDAFVYITLEKQAYKATMTVTARKEKMRLLALHSTCVNMSRRPRINKQI